MRRRPDSRKKRTCREWDQSPRREHARADEAKDGIVLIVDAHRQQVESPAATAGLPRCHGGARVNAASRPATKQKSLIVPGPRRAPANVPVPLSTFMGPATLGVSKPVVVKSNPVADPKVDATLPFTGIRHIPTAQTPVCDSEIVPVSCAASALGAPTSSAPTNKPRIAICLHMLLSPFRNPGTAAGTAVRDTRAS